MAGFQVFRKSTTGEKMSAHAPTQSASQLSNRFFAILRSCVRYRLVMRDFMSKNFLAGEPGAFSLAKSACSSRSSSRALLQRSCSSLFSGNSNLHKCLAIFRAALPISFSINPEKTTADMTILSLPSHLATKGRSSTSGATCTRLSPPMIFFKFSSWTPEK